MKSDGVRSQDPILQGEESDLPSRFIDPSGFNTRIPTTGQRNPVENLTTSVL